MEARIAKAEWPNGSGFVTGVLQTALAAFAGRSESRESRQRKKYERFLTFGNIL